MRVELAAIRESRGECKRPDLSNTELHVFVYGELASAPRENPGGDPIHLLRQLADHCAERNLPPHGSNLGNKLSIRAQINFNPGYAEA
jgi:hypothetical protein